MHWLRRMSAAIAGFGTEPWALDVVTRDDSAERRSGAKPLENFEPPAQRIDFVRDERRENSGDAVLLQGGQRVFKLRRRQCVGLKINAAKSVDLKVEPA